MQAGLQAFAIFQAMNLEFSEMYDTLLTPSR
jgi:predicted outer membrane lipoprotein